MVPFDLSQFDDEALAARGRWFRSLTPEQRLKQLDEWVKEALEIDPEIVNRKNAEARPLFGTYRVLDLRDVGRGPR